MEAGKQIIAEFLISRGADVNKKTFAGNTALHTASGRDMEYMVKLLMQNGANVNIANMEGDIPRVVRTSEQVRPFFNLVPRVSHLIAWGERGPGDKMRDPGNEVDDFYALPSNHLEWTHSQQKKKSYLFRF